ncbi:MAG TPA: hypothetical protein VFW11_02340 [Cyclobacteriaceae bacterium]|nr:hypothetical protein [Cyclobacteriaceae bacterium]
MNKIYLSLAFVSLPLISLAQDEGSIVKKERIDLDKGIFIGGGPSFTLGKNIGDYSTGLNIEAGYTKRVNRILSIGPSLSYISFKYDPQETGDNNVFLDRQQEYYDQTYNLYWRPGMYVDFHGGDMSLLSAAFNLKLNFIPIRDDSKVSLYAFAKPFITYAKRTEVKGDSYVFRVYDIDGNEDYTAEEAVTSIEETGSVLVPWEAGDPTWASQGLVISDDLKEDTRLTGGIFVGPGIEILPAKNVSFFAQVAIGYTFPVSFISTEKYDNTDDLNEVDPSYPVTEEGFPSINLQFGVSFNF